MFGRKTTAKGARSSGGPYVTHDLVLTGRCPECSRTVRARVEHTVPMGLTATAVAMATCGRCGYDQVQVSDQF